MADRPETGQPRGGPAECASLARSARTAGPTLLLPYPALFYLVLPCRAFFRCFHSCEMALSISRLAWSRASFGSILFIIEFSMARRMAAVISLL